ncbi:MULTISPECIES: alternate-type signal peptide domain-containing protein [Micrococcaceae]|uniref:Alternate-type signal peptide domain-containing protein n=1 Tax=Arthrobacter sedimenti TaxID=2694931 RepID=A0ABV8WI40_9MICC|nr:alternate-type signal peptide domain-containing protein [Pseudarthrobacter defluvii]WJH23633.1 alternate-type signal peptide domain-containing protein [Pseudarthrobacter defluvii]
MKNSTLIKGTAAIAVGAALLLGGGGTLAAWNQDASANAGQIVAGDLGVTAVPGVWTDASKQEIKDITKYRVVPGDKLTFTQTLSVKLRGDKMAAQIKLNDATTSTFSSANVAIAPLTITDSKGAVVSKDTIIKPVADDTQTVTVSTTFNFLSTTPGVENVNATYDLSKVSYTLQQVVTGVNDGLVVAP